MDEHFCQIQPEMETFPTDPLAVDTPVDANFSEKVEKLETSNHFQHLSSGTDGFSETTPSSLITISPESLPPVNTTASTSERLYHVSSFDVDDQPDEVNGADCHKCGLCAESFSNLVEFLRHKVQHLGTCKSVSCELCFMSYARMHSLQEHYKRKHKVTLQQGRRRGRPPKMGTAEASVSSAKGGNSTELAANEVHVVITRTEEGSLGLCMENTVEMEDGSHLEKSDCSTQDVSCVEDGSDTKPLETSSLLGTRETPVAVGARNGSSLLSGGVDKLLASPVSAGTEQLEPTAGAESKVEADKDADFHFILVTRKIRGNSISYGKQVFRCLHCEFKTSWKNSLVKHMKDNHADMISIHQCMEVNSLKATQTADNQMLISLSEYNASMVKKIALPKRVRGIESQDLAGTFPCSKCSKVFGRLRYLRKHMVTHKSENRFLCDECGKSFKTRNYLQVHRKSHRAKEYQCSQCSFSSSINSVIHAHRQIHNDGCVLCDVCGAAYSDRSTLKKHKMVHDPSRPFACQYNGCTWRFKTEVMCHAHFKTHTTKATFKCHICQYCFRHKHHLQRHQAKMHGIPKTKSAPASSVGDNKENPEEEVLIPDMTNTLNVIVSPEQLQNALVNGNLVIATDMDVSTVNYEVADVAFQALMQENSTVDGETQTILIPHTDCNQIIFQQEAEI